MADAGGGHGLEPVAVDGGAVVGGPVEDSLGDDVSLTLLLGPGGIVEELVGLAVLLEVLLGDGALEAVVAEALHGGGVGGGHGHHRLGGDDALLASLHLLHLEGHGALSELRNLIQRKRASKGVRLRSAGERERLRSRAPARDRARTSIRGLGRGFCRRSVSAPDTGDADLDMDSRERTLGETAAAEDARRTARRRVGAEAVTFMVEPIAWRGRSEGAIGTSGLEKFVCGRPGERTVESQSRVRRT